jgi:hypothetical protein
VSTQAKTLVESGSEPPHVLSALPEGKLLVSGAFAGALGRRTYVIEGDGATLLAPTEVTTSFDGEYAAYLERPNDFNAQPTALVIRKIDGNEPFRLSWSSGTIHGAGWAPSDDRYSFQIGQTAYVRQVDAGSQLAFEIPEGTHAIKWLAGGSELLVVAMSAPAGQDRRAYLMDASTGALNEIVLPQEGIVGPGAEYDTFSPDGRYVGFPSISRDSTTGCFSVCNLWIMEIAIGRTCLVAKDAPSHQYPQGVGWSPDSRTATYYAKYEPGRFYEEHAVDVRTCTDTAVEPTPLPATPTKLPMPGLAVGFNANAMSSPSGRYLLVSTSQTAVRPLPMGMTPPPEKPFAGTPSPGAAQMYVVDTQTGKVTTLVDEQREFVPTAWLP